MQKLENDPLTTQVLIANDSSYGRTMDEAMKTFVTRKEELNNVDFRGQNEFQPRVFRVNPNPKLCFSKITITLMKEILEQENLVASEREFVITMGCLIVEDLEKKLKKKRKRLREEFTVKRKMMMMMMS